MPVLHNRVSQKELKQKLFAETEKRITFSFYKYFSIDNPSGFRDALYSNLHQLKVFGRIYVAHEGVNAQVSIPESQFNFFRNYLDSVAPLKDIRINIAVEDNGKSFWVLKIKTRAKIVADGIRDPSFDMSVKGKYVNAEQMNKLIDDPSTIVIDMRNHYEYEVGHFVNAIEIPSDTFREQLPMAVDMVKDKKENNIVMYCTGGIRCEKASAWLLHRGFKNVFHLEGGIIQYAKSASEQGLESKFIGKNFVFDGRMGERITADIIANCHICGKPADTHVNCVNDACHLLFIQCERCAADYEGCCSKECLETIHLPVLEQKRKRAGQSKGQQIMHKSKARMLQQQKSNSKRAEKL